VIARSAGVVRFPAKFLMVLAYAGADMFVMLAGVVHAPRGLVALT
jgi:hypothetical protein